MQTDSFTQSSWAMKTGNHRAPAYYQISTSEVLLGESLVGSSTPRSQAAALSRRHEHTFDRSFRGFCRGTDRRSVSRRSSMNPSLSFLLPIVLWLSSGLATDAAAPARLTGDDASFNAAAHRYLAWQRRSLFAAHRVDLVELAWCYSVYSTSSRLQPGQTPALGPR